MKQIQSYASEKYTFPSYTRIAEGIYAKENIFTTSLCFLQEPELGEGTSAADISQYPLEDILDRYLVYISDFYPELNVPNSQLCYLEFASPCLNDIRQLRGLIGKHVYNQTKGSADGSTVNLIIE